MWPWQRGSSESLGPECAVAGSSGTVTIHHGSRVAERANRVPDEGIRGVGVRSHDEHGDVEQFGSGRNARHLGRCTATGGHVKSQFSM